MKLYLVRHGQTTDNATNIHQTSQAELSQTGREQADWVGNRFKDVPLDMIIASDHVRTRQTAEAINQHHQRPIEFTPLLRERRRPSEISGQPKDDPKVKEIRQLCESHFQEKDWHYSDEENFFDIVERSHRCWQYIEQLREEKAVNHLLAVSHNAFIQVLVLDMVLGEVFQPQHFQATRTRMNMTNSGVTVCEYDQNGWRLLTWNDYAHLPSE